MPWRLKDTAGEFKKEKQAFFEIISLLKIIAERAFYREADPSISGNSPAVSFNRRV
jgi:hypothetical protein